MCETSCNLERIWKILCKFWEKMIWKIRNFRCSTIVFPRLTILSPFQMMRWCYFVQTPGLICFTNSPGLICGELGARHPCVELQPNLAGNSDSFDLCLSSVVQNSQIWHFQRFSTFSPFYFNFLKKVHLVPLVIDIAGGVQRASSLQVEEQI